MVVIRDPSPSASSGFGISEKFGGSLLYWLLYQRLFSHFPPFRIFRYATFRTAFPSLTALFMGLIIGPAIIRQLREFQIGQYIPEDGPSRHQKQPGPRPIGRCLIVLSNLWPAPLSAHPPT